MQNNLHIIALTGNSSSGIRTLLSRLANPLPIAWIGLKRSYQYSGLNCLLTTLEARRFSDHQQPEVIVLVCDAFCLEQGLHQLKELLSLEQVREQGIPLILCVSSWEEAESKGICIDMTLLQDVLQIPVVPYSAHSREQLDDVKAAIHYSLQPAKQKEFYYQCLDFSPGKLARECTLHTGALYRLHRRLPPDKLASSFGSSLFHAASFFLKAFCFKLKPPFPGNYFLTGNKGLL